MAVSNKKFYNRQGEEIPFETFKENRADPKYAMVREFDNGEVHVEAVWVGEVRNPQNYFPGMRPIFMLKIYNYDHLDELRPDVQSGATFSSEEELVEAYENFIEKWTESERDEEGHLREVDNSLTPQRPDLDTPKSDISEMKWDATGASDVGAW